MWKERYNFNKHTHTHTHIYIYIYMIWVDWVQRCHNLAITCQVKPCKILKPSLQLVVSIEFEVLTKGLALLNWGAIMRAMVICLFKCVLFTYGVSK